MGNHRGRAQYFQRSARCAITERSGREYEIARVRITDAGRRALSEARR
jgi:hypothetical protein